MAIGTANSPVPMISPRQLSSYKSAHPLAMELKPMQGAGLTVCKEVLFPGTYTSTSRPSSSPSSASYSSAYTSLTLRIDGVGDAIVTLSLLRRCVLCDRPRPFSSALYV